MSMFEIKFAEGYNDGQRVCQHNVFYRYEAALRSAQSLLTPVIEVKEGVSNHRMRTEVIGLSEGKVKTILILERAE